MIKRLEALLDTEHDGPLLRFGLASAFYHIEKWDRAVEHAAIAAQQNEDYSAAWRLLGRSQLELGNTEAAREAFDQGLAAAKRCKDEQTAKEIGVFLRRLDKK